MAKNNKTTAAQRAFNTLYKKEEEEKESVSTVAQRAFNSLYNSEYSAQKSVDPYQAAVAQYNNVPTTKFGSLDTRKPSDNSRVNNTKFSSTVKPEPKQTETKTTMYGSLKDEKTDKTKNNQLGAGEFDTKRTLNELNNLPDMSVQEFKEQYGNSKFAPRTDVSTYSKEEEEARRQAIKDEYESIPERNAIERYINWFTRTNAGHVLPEGFANYDEEYARKQELYPEYRKIKNDEAVEDLLKKGFTEDDLLYTNKNALTQEDIDELRKSGKSDEEIEKIAEDIFNKSEDARQRLYDYTMDQRNNEAGLSYQDYMNAIEDYYANPAVKEGAKAHPISSSVLSLATNPAEAIYSLGANAINFATGKPILNYNTTTDLMREGVNEKIGNRLGQIAYGGVMSIGDMAVAQTIDFALGGGGLISAGLQAAEKAAQVSNEGVEKGLSPNKIFAESIASGLTTFVTEKISMGKLSDIAEKGLTNYSKKEIAKTLGASFVTEGGQEGLEDIADWITNSIIDWDKNEFKKAYDEYIENGYTEDQAVAHVIGDKLVELVSDVVMGGIGGATMAGAGSGVAYYAGKINPNPHVNTDAVLESDQALAQLVEAAKTIDTSKVDEKTAKILEEVSKKDLDDVTVEDVIDLANVLNEQANPENNLAETIQEINYQANYENNINEYRETGKISEKENELPIEKAAREQAQLAVEGYNKALDEQQKQVQRDFINDLKSYKKNNWQSNEDVKNRTLQSLNEASNYFENETAAKNFIDNYKGQNLRMYAEVSYLAYTAGETGQSFDTFLKNSVEADLMIKHGGVDKGYLKTLFYNGQNARRTAEDNVVLKKNENRGLATNLTPDDQLAVFKKAIAKKLGIEVNTNFDNAESRGNFVASLAKLVTNSTSDNEYQTIIHEMFEFARTYNAKGMELVDKTLTDMIVKKKGERSFVDAVNTYKEAYRRAGKSAPEGSDLRSEANKSASEAQDEFINDAISYIFSTDEGIQQLVDYIMSDETTTAQEKVSTIQAIKDWVDNLIKAIKNFLSGHKTEQYGYKYAEDLKLKSDELKAISLKLVTVLEDARKNLEAMTETEGKTEEKVAHQIAVTEENAKAERKIKIDSTDNERYEILKERTIFVPSYDKEKINILDEKGNPLYDFEELEKTKLIEAKKSFRDLAIRLGLFRDGYRTQDLEIEFEFGVNKLFESLNNQDSVEMDNKRTKYAYLMSCLPETIENAHLLKVNPDRYIGTEYEDTSLINVYELISAFEDDKFIYPVKMEIKEYNNKKAGLYVTAVYPEINKASISGMELEKESQGLIPRRPLSDYMLAKVLTSVKNNPNSEGLGKYIPIQFIGDINEINNSYLEAVNNGNKKLAKYYIKLAADEAFKESKARKNDGVIREFYHGTSSDIFNEFDPDMIGTANDTGFFGKGFYFAFTEGEARMYGQNVIKAYLNAINPYYVEDLYKWNGKSVRDFEGDLSNALFALNFTKEFPEFAKDVEFKTYDNEGNPKEYNLTQFEKDLTETLKNQKFVINKRKDETWGNILTAKTDKVKEDGIEWYEYEKEYAAKTVDPVLLAYDYLVETKYNDVFVSNPRDLIMDHEFSQALRGKGHDSIFQKREGDEAVVFESNQVASSDITYDDNGNVIPLTERFNTGNKDIRYSIAVTQDSTGKELSEGQKEYFKNTKVLDEDGDLLKVYHGTLRTFYTFDRSFANGEGDMGKGFYFTNDENDVERNYANEDGADFTNKIEHEAELLEYEEGYEDKSHEEIVEELKQKYIEEPITLECYLNITNPCYVGSYNGHLETYLLSADEMELPSEEDFEDEDEYYEAQDEAVYEIIEDLVDYEYAEQVNPILYDAVMEGGITLENLKKRLNELYLEDEEGNIIGNEIARQIVEGLGYDGIIDSTVSEKFKRMDLTSDSTHFIVFDSNQAKLISNENPTEKDDIRYSIAVTEDNTGRKLSEGQQTYFGKSVIRDKEGRLKVMYHGTPRAGFTIFERSDDGISFFFTDNKKVAGTYSGVDYVGNPDTPMTFNELNETAEAVSDGTFTEVGGKIVFESEDRTETFDSIKDAQNWLIDEYINPMAYQGESGATNYAVYLKAENPLIIDAKGKDWNNITPNYKRKYANIDITKIGDDSYEVDYLYGKKYEHKTVNGKELDNLFGKGTLENLEFYDDYANLAYAYVDENGDRIPTTTRGYAKYAYDHGYDSVIFNNVVDSGGYNPYGATESQVVVVFNSNQIKSVYNINPTENPDIRYSIDVPFFDSFEEIDNKVDLDEKDLQKLVENISDLDSKVSQKAVDDIAAQIKKQYNSKIDKKRLSNDIMSVFRYLKATANMKMDDVMFVMSEIARPVLEQVEAVDPLQEKLYKDFVDKVKNYKISLDAGQTQEVINEYGSYFNFVNAMKGKLHLTKEGTPLDNVWTEICDVSGGALSYGTNPNDQPTALADYIMSLNPTAQELKGESLESASTDLALEIFRQFYVYQSMADAAAKVKGELTKRANEAKERYKQKYNEAIKEVEREKALNIQRLSEEIDNLTAEQQEAIRRGDAVNQAYIENLRKDYAKRLDNLRAQQNEKIAKIKAQYQNSWINKNLRRQTSELKNRLLREVKALQNMIAHPQEGASKHVPVNLINPTIQMLEAINLDNGGRNKAIADRLKKMAEVYESFKNDPNYSFDYDERIASDIEELQEMFARRSYADLGVTELQRVIEIVTALKTQIKNANNLILQDKLADAKAAATEAMNQVKGSRRHDNAAMNALNAYGNLHLNAYREFRKLSGYRDGALMDIYNDLDEGSRREMQIQKDLGQIFQDVLEGQKNQKEVKKFISTKDEDLVDIGITDKNGKPIKITRAMRMSLIMHSMNAGNMRHVLGSGITIPNMYYFAKGKLDEAYAKGTNYRFVDYAELLDAIQRNDQNKVAELTTKAQERVEALKKDLSAWEKKFLKDAEKMFHDETGKLINETSMKLKGYAIARVKNYFPIRTDRHFTKQEWAGLVQDASLEGMGMLKERVISSKPILLEDITNVIQRQIKNVSKYAGLAVPVRNFETIMKQTMRDQNDGQLHNLYETIDSVWGSSDSNWLKNLMQDIQGGRKEADSPIARFLVKLRGNFAAATLTTNLGVAIKQAASYPTAAAVVGWKHLIRNIPKFGKGFTGKGIKELEEINPLLWFREQGYGTQDLADAKSSDIMKKMPPALQKALGWTQLVDTGTVRTLEYVAKSYVDDKFKNLEQGSEEYWQKVSDVFTSIVEETQPNYSKLQQADVIRNPNTLSKMLVMFKTQPLQNFGIIYDSMGELNAAIQSGDATWKKEASSKVARAVSSQVVSASVFSAMTFVANLLKHRTDRYKDDDDEWSWEKILREFGLSFVSSLVGGFLAGSLIYEGLSYAIDKFTNKKGARYYGLEISAVETINDIINKAGKLASMASALVNAKTTADKELALKNSLDTITSFSESIGEYAGIPVRNIELLLLSMYYYSLDAIQGIKSGEFKVSSDRDIFDDWEVKTQYERIYEAFLNGDGEKADKYTQELINKALKESKDELKAGDTTEDAIIETVKNDIVDKFKDIIKADLMGGDITEEEAEQYLVDMTDKTEDEAYYQIKRWEGHSSSEYQYAKDIIAEAASDPTPENRAKVIKEIEGLVEHGKKKDGVRDSLKGTFKDEYVNLYNQGKAADLNSILRTALVTAGYTDEEAKEILAKWLE